MLRIAHGCDERSIMKNRREFLFAASAFPALLSGRTSAQLFKAGTCLGGRDEEGFWKNCSSAREAGFHNIESSGAGVRLAELYDGRSQELKQQFETRKLNLVGYAQYSPMSDRSALKQIIDLHLRIARILQPLGASYITQLLTPPPKAGVPPAKLPAAMTSEEIRNFTANLNQVAKSLRGETKLRIGFHAETPEVAAGLLDAVMEGTDPKYFDLVADVGHITAGGLDPLEVCRKYRSRLIAVHLRDWDPDAKYERNGEQVTGRFVPLGQGKIDLPKLMEFLRATNFSGEINAEGGGLSPSFDYMTKKLSIEV
jgi:sugar phosphate isomerase/epimerase